MQYRSKVGKEDLNYIEGYVLYKIEDIKSNTIFKKIN